MATGGKGGCRAGCRSCCRRLGCRLCRLCPGFFGEPGFGEGELLGLLPLLRHGPDAKAQVRDRLRKQPADFDEERQDGQGQAADREAEPAVIGRPR